MVGLLDRGQPARRFVALSCNVRRVVRWFGLLRRAWHYRGLVVCLFRVLDPVMCTSSRSADARHRHAAPAMRNVVRNAILALLVTIAGCSAQREPTAMPAGVVFITERVPVEGMDGFTAGVTREYRDGHLVSTQPGLPIVARADAGGSLYYTHVSHSARWVRDGHTMPFNPCKDPYNVPLVALSPNGKRGVCIARYDHSNDLVLFDTQDAAATGRVIFRRTFDNPQPFAWINNGRIAVMELRPHRCPFYRKYGYAPTNLAVIDLSGHVIRRGPCMAGVLAGPKGLIYLQLFDDRGVAAFIDSVLDRHDSAEYFSTDYGRTWRRGSPAFQDADGAVYYWPNYGSDDTLVDEQGRVVATNAFSAGWAAQ